MVAESGVLAAGLPRVSGANETALGRPVGNVISSWKLTSDPYHEMETMARVVTVFKPFFQ
jgi:hypothetical protein